MTRIYALAALLLAVPACSGQPTQPAQPNQPTAPVPVAGRFNVEVIAADPGRSCVTAYWYAPKVAGATLYQLRGHNYNDPAFWGTEFTRSWSGPVTDRGGRNTEIDDLGSEWRGGLSGTCGPTANSAQYEATLRSRFAGMLVEVTATVP